jgi:hypothetical protein
MVSESGRHSVRTLQRPLDRLEARHLAHGIEPRDRLQLMRYALRSRVAQPDPRPEVRQTQLYGMFPMILFASSIVKPRSVSLRTLPREPALSRAVVTASSVPSTMLIAS